MNFPHGQTHLLRSSWSGPFSSLLALLTGSFSIFCHDLTHLCLGTMRVSYQNIAGDN